MCRTYLIVFEYYYIENALISKIILILDRTKTKILQAEEDKAWQIMSNEGVLETTKW